MTGVGIEKRREFYKKLFPLISLSYVSVIVLEAYFQLDKKQVSKRIDELNSWGIKIICRTDIDLKSHARYYKLETPIEQALSQVMAFISKPFTCKVCGGHKQYANMVKVKTQLTGVCWECEVKRIEKEGQVCTLCKRHLPAKAFGVNKNIRTGISRQCRTCCNDRVSSKTDMTPLEESPGLPEKKQTRPKRTFPLVGYDSWALLTTDTQNIAKNNDALLRERGCLSIDSEYHKRLLCIRKERHN